MCLREPRAITAPSPAWTHGGTQSKSTGKCEVSIPQRNHIRMSYHPAEVVVLESQCSSHAGLAAARSRLIVQARALCKTEGKVWSTRCIYKFPGDQCPVGARRFYERPRSTVLYTHTHTALSAYTGLVRRCTCSQAGQPNSSNVHGRSQLLQPGSARPFTSPTSSKTDIDDADASLQALPARPHHTHLPLVDVRGAVLIPAVK